MLSGVQKVDSLSSGNFSKDQSAEHRNGIRRGTVEMPGGFSRGIKTAHRPALAQDFRPFVGRKAAECISDGADQGIGQKRRLCDRARPVRFWRLQFGSGRQPIATRRIEARNVAGSRGVECCNGFFQIAGGNCDMRGKLGERCGLNRWHFGSDRALEAGNIE